MLGKNLKVYLDTVGIKQATVAEAAGISPSAMSRVFSGSRKLSAEEYLAICEYLQVPPDTFKIKMEDESE